MNALVLVFVSLCLFAIGYRYYGLFIARNMLGLNPKNPTPAVSMADGVDYVKTNKLVLFGHHFAAIAAAGPLLGPVLAAQFGYSRARSGSSSGALWPVRSTTWSCSLPRCGTTAEPCEDSRNRDGKDRRHGRVLRDPVHPHLDPRGSFHRGRERDVLKPLGDLRRLRDDADRLIMGLYMHVWRDGDVDGGEHHRRGPALCRSHRRSLRC